MNITEYIKTKHGYEKEKARCVREREAEIERLYEEYIEKGCDIDGIDFDDYIYENIDIRFCF